MNVESLDPYIEKVWDELAIHSACYLIPKDSGIKTALARCFANLFFSEADNAYVYIDEWGVWPSSENLDLFYGYRNSKGENRLISEAPFHFFDKEELGPFISILGTAFYFVWNATVIRSDQRCILKVSHDEWIEIRTEDESAFKEYTDAMEYFGLKQIQK